MAKVILQPIGHSIEGSTEEKSYLKNLEYMEVLSLYERLGGTGLEIRRHTIRRGCGHGRPAVRAADMTPSAGTSGYLSNHIWATPQPY